MAVIGVGIDVADIERFAASLERTPGLRERLFTASESSRPRTAVYALLTGVLDDYPNHQ